MRRVRALLFQAAKQDVEGQPIFESLLHSDSNEDLLGSSVHSDTSSTHAGIAEDDLDIDHPPIILLEPSDNVDMSKRRHSAVSKPTDF